MHDVKRELDAPRNPAFLNFRLITVFEVRNTRSFEQAVPDQRGGSVGDRGPRNDARGTGPEPPPWWRSREVLSSAIKI